MYQYKTMSKHYSIPALSSSPLLSGFPAILTEHGSHGILIDWRGLSSHLSVDWSVVEQNPQCPWDYNSLSENSSITWKEIIAHPGLPWNWKKIGKRFSSDMIEKVDLSLWGWRKDGSDVSEQANLQLPETQLQMPFYIFTAYTQSLVKHMKTLSEHGVHEKYLRRLCDVYLDNAADIAQSQEGYMLLYTFEEEVLLPLCSCWPPANYYCEQIAQFACAGIV